MKTTIASVANLYNPHNQDKEELIAGFVVRIPLFERLYQEIIDWEDTIQNYLIEGKRGMGKTTLLLRLSYEIENNPELKWLIPIVFKEEIYCRVNRLERLWEETAQFLENKDAKFIGLYQKMTNQYKEGMDYERLAFELLAQALQKTQKKIILFIDNLGEMLRNFNLTENQRLREILMTNRNIRIVGSTSIIFETFFDYKHPFFEFFRVIPLKGLNKAETETLLLNLAASEGEEKEMQAIILHNAARVETLRQLTGGVTRTLVLVFDILLSDEDGKAMSDLEQILDQVTTLYQHRLADLNSDQRVLIDKIALAWDAIGLEELGKQSRLRKDEVEKTLAELVKLEIIQRVPTTTDINLYQIQERFFNIWYLMRLAPANQKQKVIWLVRFFEAWYCEAELIRKKVNQFIENLAYSKYSFKDSLVFIYTFSQIPNLGMQKQYQLIQSTKEHFKNNLNFDENDFPKSDYELLIEADKLLKNDDFTNALNYYLEIINKTNLIHSTIGYIYQSLNNYKEAETHYLLAGEEDADALNNLGVIYMYTDRLDLAEDNFKKAVTKGNPNAIRNLGTFYFEKRQEYNLAKKYFNDAINSGNKEAVIDLAILYATIEDDYSEAKKLLLPLANEGHPIALRNLGVFYQDIENDDIKAEKCYLAASDRGDISAKVNLGFLYDKQNNDEKAEKYYLEAAEKGEALAYHNLAVLYYKRNQIEKAIDYSKKATSLNSKNLLFSIFLAQLFLLNKEIDKAESLISFLFKFEDSAKTYEWQYNNYLKTLLYFKYYQYFESHFNNPDHNFKERFKPLYYAYLKITNHPDFMKMPTEIGELVAQIVQEVNQMALELNSE